MDWLAVAVAGLGSTSISSVIAKVFDYYHFPNSNKLALDAQAIAVAAAEATHAKFVEVLPSIITPAVTAIVDAGATKTAALVNQAAGIVGTLAGAAPEFANRFAPSLVVPVGQAALRVQQAAGAAEAAAQVVAEKAGAAPAS